MQLTQTLAPVATSGQSLRTSEFQMKMNQKMFEIFSSSIYSNKIRAVVRELCTNAFDIHKTTGIGNVPFEVSVPTTDNPMFVVRDFGTGLSEEQVFDIYTVYFESTKDGDDEAHGGYGLGSKSPLAYVDSFQIRSYQDGILKCYTCYRKNGTPMISLILETTTDEPNGLEVSVAVNESDFKRFNTEIGYVLSTFPVKPTIVNGEVSYFNFKETEKELFSITNFPNVVDRDNQFFVYIEPVLYPLLNDMKQIFKNSKLYNMFFRNDSGRYAFKFPIGSMMIPPSREQIDNTKFNIDAFQKYMDNIDQLYSVKLNDIYERTKDLPYCDALTTVSKEIEGITGVKNSGLLATFMENKDYIYAHPFGDMQQYDERVAIKEDKTTGIIEYGIVKKFSPSEKIRLSPIEKVMYRSLKSGVPLFQARYFDPKSKVSFGYNSGCEEFVPYVMGKKLVIFTLDQKNYRKFIEHFEEQMKSDYQQNQFIYMLNKTKDEVMDELNDWSFSGKVTDIFPNIEVVEFADIRKKYPLSRNTSGMTASVRGTKPHAHLLLDGGSIVNDETSINDLIKLVDESTDTVKYIRSDEASATSYTNIIKAVKRSWALSNVCADLFAEFEGTLIFTNQKFDVTIEKMTKNGVDIENVTDVFFEKMKEHIRQYFMTTENWVYNNLSNSGSGRELFGRISYNNKITSYLGKKYDVLWHRRVKNKRDELFPNAQAPVTFDTTHEYLRIIRNADSFNSIFSVHEYSELFEYHSEVEELIHYKMKEIEKKIPLLVALCKSVVYNSDETTADLILEHMKEKGV